MFATAFPDGFLQAFVTPWYEALEDPEGAQRRALLELVDGYRKTDYGKQHAADEVDNVADFRKNFPIVSYPKLQPVLENVRTGNHFILLPEPVLCWVMTRGSTGSSKVLPATKTHLEQIFACGARAIVNHALRNKDPSLLAGRILNLNFPSEVATLETGGRTVSYGYSSGTYARLNPMLNQVSLLPRQEEIDALGSGITRQDWERRFELVYQRAQNENVTAAMGVTPVILAFARYVAKRYGKKPKDMWQPRALFCTSVRKIQFKYAPKLRAHYGNVPVVEMYTATEGVFGQQLDDLPFISPNCDKYVFEVKTGQGLKMLHELRRGEWGSLVVSSCLFPRYDIGDMVEAMGRNYFRVFGRATTLAVLEHRLYRLFFGWFL